MSSSADFSDEDDFSQKSGSASPAPGDTLPWNLPKHERSKRKIHGGSVLDPAERAVLRIAGKRVGEGTDPWWELRKFTHLCPWEPELGADALGRGLCSRWGRRMTVFTLCLISIEKAVCPACWWLSCLALSSGWMDWYLRIARRIFTDICIKLSLFTCPSCCDILKVLTSVIPSVFARICEKAPFISIFCPGTLSFAGLTGVDSWCLVYAIAEGIPATWMPFFFFF